MIGARPRHRLSREIEDDVEGILARHKVQRYLKVKVGTVETYTYKQGKRGHPGPNTTFVRKTKKAWHLTWEIDQAAVDYDRKSDGMDPLLTNDRTLTNAQVLEAHKGQPAIEKRFEQTKSVLEIAPVLLKNAGRIEAFFLVYFLALMVQALSERDLRLAMTREGIEKLPIYPEERPLSQWACAWTWAATCPVGPAASSSKRIAWRFSARARVTPVQALLPGQWSAMTQASGLSTQWLRATAPSMAWTTSRREISWAGRARRTPPPEPRQELIRPALTNCPTRRLTKGMGNWRSRAISAMATWVPGSRAARCSTSLVA